MGTVTKLRRHGDVLIKTRDGFKAPEGLDWKPVTLLHRGQNHDHSIKRGTALEATVDGYRHLRVVEDLTLDHPEHGEGTVPVGDHWVEIKSEYDHLEEESRQVID